jgi:proteasome lid subunit RPN8/RPN11
MKLQQRLRRFSIIKSKGFRKMDRNIIYVNKPADEWECEIDTVKECSKAPKDDEMIIFLKPLVKRKIDLLMDKYKSREWLAYLFGEVGERIVIEDLDVPEQTATAARVEDVEYEVPEGKRVIGVMHSHHNMGCTFSGTDDSWINMNHDISILVAHSGIQARVRWIAPCGAKKPIKAKVRLMLDVEMDAEKFLADVEEKLREPAARHVPRYGFDDGEYGSYPYSAYGAWHNRDISNNKADEKEETLREALKADSIV